MSDFYRSVAFKKFIESDMPKIASALTDISKQLARINEREDKKLRLEEKLLQLKIRNESRQVNG